MNKFNVAKMYKTVKVAVKKHSPEILTGIGIAGMVTSTFLAVKATPKALELIEAEKRSQNHKNLEEAKKNGEEVYDQVTKLKPVEVIKLTWKCYLPAAITSATSIACLVGASSVNARRNAALATAYKISETALTEYREKVVETIGESKEKHIREQVDKDKIENQPVSKNTVIVTGKGTTLCYDPIARSYFESDIERIRRAENTINKRMLQDICGYASLNDFYDELGLDHSVMGDDLGWNVDNMLDIDFSSQITDDGRPCIVLEFTVAPKYNYDKLY
jgi:hypothetical protein